MLDDDLRLLLEREIRLGERMKGEGEEYLTEDEITEKIEQEIRVKKNSQETEKQNEFMI